MSFFLKRFFQCQEEYSAGKILLIKHFLMTSLEEAIAGPSTCGTWPLNQLRMHFCTCSFDANEDFLIFCFACSLWCFYRWGHILCVSDLSHFLSRLTVVYAVCRSDDDGSLRQEAKQGEPIVCINTWGENFCPRKNMCWKSINIIGYEFSLSTLYKCSAAL